MPRGLSSVFTMTIGTIFWNLLCLLWNKLSLWPLWW